MSPRRSRAWQRLRQAAGGVALVLVAAVGWAGYHVGDAPRAWSALWSLCTAPR